MIKIKKCCSYLIAAAIVTLILSTPASATWSILGVERDTGEIGIAGASCTFDVSGIASIVPKKGAIVVQAASNYFARMKGVEMMENNATVDDIMSAMKADNFTPERQQYAIVSLQNDQQPQVSSGAEIKDWSGSKITNDFAISGNILVGEKVLTAVLNTLNENPKAPFAQRLMAALLAGANSGGDKRCGEQKARSAFLSVYDPKTDAITKLSVYGIEPGGKPAVTLLDEKFKQLY